MPGSWNSKPPLYGGQPLAGTLSSVVERAFSKLEVTSSNLVECNFFCILSAWSDAPWSQLRPDEVSHRSVKCGGVGGWQRGGISLVTDKSVGTFTSLVSSRSPVRPGRVQFFCILSAWSDAPWSQLRPGKVSHRSVKCGGVGGWQRGGISLATDKSVGNSRTLFGNLRGMRPLKVHR